MPEQFSKIRVGVDHHLMSLKRLGVIIRAAEINSEFHSKLWLLRPASF